jgi:hypothetical protein
MEEGLLKQWEQVFKCSLIMILLLNVILHLLMMRLKLLKEDVVIENLVIGA